VIYKAAQYLLLAGQKSLDRYALDATQRYYEQAYAMLTGGQIEESPEMRHLLLDLLHHTGFPYYYQSRFVDLADLLKRHEPMAEAELDQGRKGQFFAWQGFAFWGSGHLRDSRRYMHKAIAIAEASGDQYVIAFASCWLSFAEADLGNIAEGIATAQRAH